MKILIAIHGAHSQPEHRKAQRETWLRDLQDVDYKFFLGAPQDDEEDVVYGTYPDGPLEERGRRTWHSNRKTEAIAEYALEEGYDFVFKCDDDTYCRPAELLESGFEDHDYVGFADKHYTRELGWYRWAQGGAGYWLSRLSMQIIADNGLTVIPAEDFAVGNVLAGHGIAPHGDPRYVPAVTAQELESFIVTRGSFLTLHKVAPNWMRRLYEADQAKSGVGAHQKAYLELPQRDGVTPPFD